MNTAFSHSPNRTGGAQKKHGLVSEGSLPDPLDEEERRKTPRHMTRNMERQGRHAHCRKPRSMQF